jgi:hypothetical protein
MGRRNDRSAGIRLCASCAGFDVLVPPVVEAGPGPENFPTMQAPVGPNDVPEMQVLRQLSPAADMRLNRSWAAMCQLLPNAPQQ